ncbi:hypothetical protein HNO86_09685 [Pseudomonas sp. C1C7]|nr:hypothetical protein [Pseudomonas sp. C1C7]
MKRGCDLLILKIQKSKDRGLRQILQGLYGHEKTRRSGFFMKQEAFT